MEASSIPHVVQMDQIISDLNWPDLPVARNATSQPTYDFLSGNTTPPGPPPLDVLKFSSTPKTDHTNEDLRAEIKSLQYKLSNIDQERALTALRHENELREAQKKAESDFKRAQALEINSEIALTKYEALLKELKEIQDRGINEKQDLERKLRSLQDKTRILEEEAEDMQNELGSQERQFKRRLSELESKNETYQKLLDELRGDLEQKASTLFTTQQRLSTREAEVGKLEGDVLRLKAQTGDVDTLGIIKRELSEQVAHIKKLESTTRDQSAELKHYRRLHKSLEVVEEEKMVLEGKVRMMDDLRRELAEAQLQKSILEDERKSWTSYFQKEASKEGDMEFDSPEALARALVQERLERASLVEKMGSFEPELLEKDEIIKELEKEKYRLLSEVEKARSSGTATSESRVRARLEKQRALAIKEVEYLRAQLRTFEAEDTVFQPGILVDEQKSKRIIELEDLIEQYRNELLSVNQDLVKQEESLSVPETTSTKRPHEDEPDERLGHQLRRNRMLQAEISALQKSSSLLEKELEATKSRLKSASNNSRTRILEFRSNPTAVSEQIKLSTLASLKEENAALLAQLTARQEDEDGHHLPPAKFVPISTLVNLKRDLADMEKVVAEKEKRMMRLKGVWSAKALEFREAVASVLGWKMDFMPNGRVRVTSMFCLSEEDGENSIIFDGEKGTMKISGGPTSLFALEIKNQIKFWVEERKDIPCFLAAVTLEFYEKTTRAARM
ncbi:MAG: coiled-coil domain-containing protein mad1 [Trizodia sp. TS-e1964]|nr:MAG: coiled-coil domain-containing protein mad1 [Trizodia sp. TS-e1964]